MTSGIFRGYRHPRGPYSQLALPDENYTPIENDGADIGPEMPGVMPPLMPPDQGPAVDPAAREYYTARIPGLIADAEAGA